MSAATRARKRLAQGLPLTVKELKLKKRLEREAHAARVRDREEAEWWRREWLACHRDVAIVAADALQQGDRGRAIRVLCEAVHVDKAIRMTEQTASWHVRRGCLTRVTP